MTKPVGGRPLELTPEIIADAGRLARETLYVECVAGLLGIGRSTFYRWLRRGAKESRRRERGKSPLAREELPCQFWHTVQKGFFESESQHLRNITQAAEKQWQASAWVLERTHPQRWSQHTEEIRKLRKEVDELVKQQNGGTNAKAE